MSDPIFQRSLQDLVKGIRNHKKDTSSFISQAIAEIKQEVKSTDPFIKAEAVSVLLYLSKERLLIYLFDRFERSLICK